MAKRRRKKERETKEKSKELSKATKKESTFVDKKHYGKILVIGVVFFISGFLINYGIIAMSQGISKSNDQLIFISPPGCANCDQMEEVAKEVAEELKIPFTKTSFTRQLTTAGCVLIFDDVLSIMEARDESTFKQSICSLTKNKKICSEVQEQPPEQPEPSTPEVPKSDKPKVELFVMSYCPFGLQMQKAYIPVMELLKDKAEMSVNFVSYIMHGKKEIDENMRQYCIQKEQNEKFTSYLKCFVVDGDYEKCLDEVGIDKVKLDSCINETDEQYNVTGMYNDKSTWSGGRFPMFPVEAELNSKYGVRGSPTLVINGKTVSVTRSPEAVKQTICSAFNEPPKECEQTLSSNTEQPGLGQMGASSGSGSSGGGCGG
jgi:thiol-disulfide isomerase/thioredoxin